jgi:hypothetical protein
VHTRLIKAVIFHGRVDSNTSAEKWSTSLHVKVVREAEDKLAGSDDEGRVATLGRCTSVVNTVVSEDAFGAKLLSISLALAACTARADHAANSTTLASSHVGDVGADLDNLTDNLMAGNHGESGVAPLTLDLMVIGVANSRCDDLDLNIIRANCKVNKKYKITSGGS